MENEALMHVFKNLNAKIIREVNPDSVIDQLFANDIITVDDYNGLSNVPDPKVRCRKLCVLLHRSSHPETFIHLREALQDEYPEIVDEIDKHLKSQPTPQPQQQLHRSKSTEGKLLESLVLCSLRRQSTLLRENCFASFQTRPISFRCCYMV